MTKRKVRTPRTKAEWQAAADLAHFLLATDVCQRYGLITGGPEVDVTRCIEILSRAAEKGIEPVPDAIERWARAWREDPPR